MDCGTNSFGLEEIFRNQILLKVIDDEELIVYGFGSSYWHQKHGAKDQSQSFRWGMAGSKTKIEDVCRGFFRLPQTPSVTNEK